MFSYGVYTKRATHWLIICAYWGYLYKYVLPVGSFVSSVEVASVTNSSSLPPASVESGSTAGMHSLSGIDPPYLKDSVNFTLLPQILL